MAGRYDASLTKGRALKEITISDLHWIAGFLEGEGSFTFRGRNTNATASQVQLWPLEKLQACVGGRFGTATHRQFPNRSTINVWSASGPRAIGIMLTVYCLMSPRRQGQIDKVLAEWKSRPIHNALKLVCLNGHPYDQARTITKKNGRVSSIRTCSACKKDYYNKYNAARRNTGVVNAG